MADPNIPSNLRKKKGSNTVLGLLKTPGPGKGGATGRGSARQAPSRATGQPPYTTGQGKQEMTPGRPVLPMKPGRPEMPMKVGRAIPKMPARPRGSGDLPPIKFAPGKGGPTGRGSKRPAGRSGLGRIRALALGRKVTKPKARKYGSRRTPGPTKATT